VATAGEKSKFINLVTKATPAPKGKKPHAMCVPFYLKHMPQVLSLTLTIIIRLFDHHHMTLCLSETTLFYHRLRLTSTCASSVAHPTAKSTAGLVPDWADRVADAARFTPTLALGRSSSGVGTTMADASTSHTKLPLPKPPVYELGGLDLDDEANIAAKEEHVSLSFAYQPR
jgi:hypothetical protein